MSNLLKLLARPERFELPTHGFLVYASRGLRVALKEWRKQRGLTQKEMAKLLGFTTMRWHTGSECQRRIPPLLPLALEALEYRMNAGGKKIGLTD